MSGFDTRFDIRFDRAFALVEAAVAEGRLPGAVLGLSEFGPGAGGSREDGLSEDSPREDGRRDGAPSEGSRREDGPGAGDARASGSGEWARRDGGPGEGGPREGGSSEGAPSEGIQREDGPGAGNARASGSNEWGRRDGGPSERGPSEVGQSKRGLSEGSPRRPGPGGGRRREIRACGRAQLVPAPRPMTEGTRFDLASLTKVLFTTPRILALAESGVIALDDPLTRLLPDLRQYDADAWERQVTFRQCLGHLTPFPAVAPIYTYGDDPARLRAFVLQREWRRGAPCYSDINFILLGLALERHHGRPIRALDPGPGLAWAAPPQASAATEACPWRGRVLSGEVHDENCAALQGAGHAGLFGSAAAVLDAAEALLAQPDSPAVRLQRQPLSPTRSHGWERFHPGWSGGARCSAETIGHTGFTGTGLWLDFAARRAWCLLSNRIHPSRHRDSGIMALRRAVGAALAEG